MKRGAWLLVCALAASATPALGAEGGQNAGTEATDARSVEAQRVDSEKVNPEKEGAKTAEEQKEPVRKADALTASVPTGDPGPIDPPTVDPEKSSGPSVYGFVRPSIAVRYRPNALPRDTLNYGVENSILVATIEQQPSPIFGYKLSLIMLASGISVLTGAKLTDTDAENQRPAVSATATSILANFLQEMSVYIKPFDGFLLRIGQMRTPFTLETWSTWANQIFWERASPTSFFFPTTDFGALAELSPMGDLFIIRAGVYNGSGFVAGAGKDRGILYALRADVSPFGTANTMDFEHKGLRASVGGGLFYYPSEVFDSAGFVTSHAKDLRMNFSLRLNLYGFSAQGEYMRRQTTDSVSSLKKLDTGWYAQGAYYLPLPAQWGIGPIFRYGTTSADLTFVPRTTRWIEAGVTAFAGKGGVPNASQLIFTYVSEARSTEGDSAHMVITRYLVQF